MDRKEYDQLRDIWKIPEKVISIDDLENKEPRTLLWGYTLERDSWHVYIKDRSIQAVWYEYEKDLHNMNITKNQHYVPSKRLYPEACDFEFCKLLKEKDVSLPFTTWSDEREIKREIKQYYGKTL